MKLDKRLASIDEPLNNLAAGCKEHDIFYRDNKGTKERHIADKTLADIANERMHARDASIDERLNSALGKTIMNSKVSFGMGLQ